MSEDQNNTSGTSSIVFIVLNLVNTVALASVGFIITLAFSDINDNRKRIDKFPIDYVQKVDYTEQHKQLINSIDQLKFEIKSSNKNLEDDYNRRMDKLEEQILKMISAVRLANQ